MGAFDMLRIAGSSMGMHQTWLDTLANNIANISDPENPLADADGYVRAPDTDLASQMTQLVMAQRGFQASV